MVWLIVDQLGMAPLPPLVSHDKKELTILKKRLEKVHGGDPKLYNRLPLKVVAAKLTWE